MRPVWRKLERDAVWPLANTLKPLERGRDIGPHDEINRFIKCTCEIALPAFLLGVVEQKRRAMRLPTVSNQFTVAAEQAKPRAAFGTNIANKLGSGGLINTGKCRCCECRFARCLGDPLLNQAYPQPIEVNQTSREQPDDENIYCQYPPR